MQEKHKVQHFTFNGIKFRRRAFDDLQAIADQIDLIPVLPTWLDVFGVEPLDDDDVCRERLFEIVGFPGLVMMTSRHFVDAAGIAWPSETFAVIANEDDPHSLCVLVVAEY